MGNLWLFTTEKRKSKAAQRVLEIHLSTDGKQSLDFKSSNYQSAFEMQFQK